MENKTPKLALILNLFSGSNKDKHTNSNNQLKTHRHMAKTELHRFGKIFQKLPKMMISPQPNLSGHIRREKRIRAYLSKSRSYWLERWRCHVQILRQNHAIFGYSTKTMQMSLLRPNPDHSFCISPSGVF